MNKYILMAFLGINIMLAILVGAIYSEIQDGPDAVARLSVIPEIVEPSESPANSCT